MPTAAAWPDRVANYLIRVRLPDRPGALGAVASRIGAVGGDVVSIDILQRGDGIVVDELGVELAGDGLVELVRGEILEVDGVEVESLRAVEGPLPDRDIELLGIATNLVRQATSTGVLEYVTVQVRRSLLATFAAMVSLVDPVRVTAAGDAPTAEELRATVTRGSSPVDAISVPLTRAGVVLVVGRSDPAFRAREHLRVEAIAKLADHRWSELTARPLVI